MLSNILFWRRDGGEQEEVEEEEGHAHVPSNSDLSSPVRHSGATLDIVTNAAEEVSTRVSPPPTLTELFSTRTGSCASTTPENGEGSPSLSPDPPTHREMDVKPLPRVAVLNTLSTQPRSESTTSTLSSPSRMTTTPRNSRHPGGCTRSGATIAGGGGLHDDNRESGNEEEGYLVHGTSSGADARQSYGSESPQTGEDSPVSYSPPAAHRPTIGPSSQWSPEAAPLMAVNESVPNDSDDDNEDGVDGDVDVRELCAGERTNSETGPHPHFIKRTPHLDDLGSSGGHQETPRSPEPRQGNPFWRLSGVLRESGGTVPMDENAQTVDSIVSVSLSVMSSPLPSARWEPSSYAFNSGTGSSIGNAAGAGGSAPYATPRTAAQNIHQLKTKSGAAARLGGTPVRNAGHPPGNSNAALAENRGEGGLRTIGSSSELAGIGNNASTSYPLNMYVVSPLSSPASSPRPFLWNQHTPLAAHNLSSPAPPFTGTDNTDVDVTCVRGGFTGAGENECESTDESGSIARTPPYTSAHPSPSPQMHPLASISCSTTSSFGIRTGARGGGQRSADEYHSCVPPIPLDVGPSASASSSCCSDLAHTQTGEGIIEAVGGPSGGGQEAGKEELHYGQHQSVGTAHLHHPECENRGTGTGEYAARLGPSELSLLTELENDMDDSLLMLSPMSISTMHVSRSQMHLGGGSTKGSTFSPTSASTHSLPAYRFPGNPETLGHSDVSGALSPHHQARTQSPSQVEGRAEWWPSLAGDAPHPFLRHGTTGWKSVGDMGLSSPPPYLTAQKQGVAESGLVPPVPIRRRPPMVPLSSASPLLRQQADDYDEDGLFCEEFGNRGLEDHPEHTNEGVPLVRRKCGSIEATLEGNEKHVDYVHRHHHHHHHHHCPHCGKMIKVEKKGKRKGRKTQKHKEKVNTSSGRKKKSTARKGKSKKRKKQEVKGEIPVGSPPEQQQEEEAEGVNTIKGKSKKRKEKKSIKEKRESRKKNREGTAVLTADAVSTPMRRSKSQSDASHSSSSTASSSRRSAIAVGEHFRRRSRRHGYEKNHDYQISLGRKSGITNKLKKARPTIDGKPTTASVDSSTGPAEDEDDGVEGRGTPQGTLSEPASWKAVCGAVGPRDDEEKVNENVSASTPTPQHSINIRSLLRSKSAPTLKTIYCRRHDTGRDRPSSEEEEEEEEEQPQQQRHHHHHLRTDVSHKDPHPPPPPLWRTTALPHHFTPTSTPRGGLAATTSSTPPSSTNNSFSGCVRRVSISTTTTGESAGQVAASSGRSSVLSCTSSPALMPLLMVSSIGTTTSGESRRDGTVRTSRDEAGMSDIPAGEDGFDCVGGGSSEQRNRVTGGVAEWDTRAVAPSGGGGEGDGSLALENMGQIRCVNTVGSPDTYSASRQENMEIHDDDDDDDDDDWQSSEIDLDTVRDLSSSGLAVHSTPSLIPSPRYYLGRSPRNRHGLSNTVDPPQARLEEEKMKAILEAMAREERRRSQTTVEGIEDTKAVQSHSYHDSFSSTTGSTTSSSPSSSPYESDACGSASSATQDFSSSSEECSSSSFSSRSSCFSSCSSCSCSWASTCSCTDDDGSSYSAGRRHKNRFLKGISRRGPVTDDVERLEAKFAELSRVHQLRLASTTTAAGTLRDGLRRAVKKTGTPEKLWELENYPSFRCRQEKKRHQQLYQQLQSVSSVSSVSVSGPVSPHPSDISPPLLSVPKSNPSGLNLPLGVLSTMNTIYIPPLSFCFSPRDPVSPGGTTKPTIDGSEGNGEAKQQKNKPDIVRGTIASSSSSSLSLSRNESGGVATPSQGRAFPPASLTGPPLTSTYPLPPPLSTAALRDVSLSNEEKVVGITGSPSKVLLSSTVNYTDLESQMNTSVCSQLDAVTHHSGTNKRMPQKSGGGHEAEIKDMRETEVEGSESNSATSKTSVESSDPVHGDPSTVQESQSQHQLRRHCRGHHRHASRGGNTARFSESATRQLEFKREEKRKQTAAFWREQKNESGEGRANSGDSGVGTQQQQKSITNAIASHAIKRMTETAKQPSPKAKKSANKPVEELSLPREDKDDTGVHGAVTRRERAAGGVSSLCPSPERSTSPGSASSLRASMSLPGGIGGESLTVSRSWATRRDSGGLVDVSTEEVETEEETLVLGERRRRTTAVWENAALQKGLGVPAKKTIRGSRRRTLILNKEKRDRKGEGGSFRLTGASRRQTDEGDQGRRIARRKSQESGVPAAAINSAEQQQPFFSRSASVHSHLSGPLGPLLEAGPPPSPHHHGGSSFHAASQSFSHLSAASSFTTTGVHTSSTPGKSPPLTYSPAPSSPLMMPQFFSYGATTTTTTTTLQGSGGAVLHGPPSAASTPLISKTASPATSWSQLHASLGPEGIGIQHTVHQNNYQTPQGTRGDFSPAGSASSSAVASPSHRRRTTIVPADGGRRLTTTTTVSGPEVHSSTLVMRQQKAILTTPLPISTSVSVTEAVGVSTMGATPPVPSSGGSSSIASSSIIAAHTLGPGRSSRSGANNRAALHRLAAGHVTDTALALMTGDSVIRRRPPPPPTSTSKHPRGSLSVDAKPVVLPTAGKDTVVNTLRMTVPNSTPVVLAGSPPGHLSMSPPASVSRQRTPPPLPIVPSLGSVSPKPFRKVLTPRDATRQRVALRKQKLVQREQTYDETPSVL